MVQLMIHTWMSRMEQWLQEPQSWNILDFTIPGFFVLLSLELVNCLVLKSGCTLFFLCVWSLSFICFLYFFLFTITLIKQNSNETPQIG